MTKSSRNDFPEAGNDSVHVLLTFRRHRYRPSNTTRLADIEPSSNKPTNG